MAGNNVCAIVVTFHPDPDVLDNLTLLRPEVEHLVVVDNGSSSSQLALLRAKSAQAGFELIENGQNLGIATALNIGIRRAMERHAAWLLLFDQDSRITPGFVETMLRGFVGGRHPRPIGLLVPIYKDLRSGTAIHGNRLEGAELEVAITSGSLLQSETVQRCGFFVDELFIDAVDHEYSLRLRRAGYGLYECPDATLLHSPGTPRMHRFPGGKTFQTANYSPLRRYYQERNKIWMAKHYLFRFPRFCLREFVASVKDFTKILLVEPADKGRKSLFFLRGIWDGLRGRYGRL